MMDDHLGNPSQAAPLRDAAFTVERQGKAGDLAPAGAGLAMIDRGLDRLRGSLAEGRP
jgi:hypothetical protein